MVLDTRRRASRAYRHHLFDRIMVDTQVYETNGIYPTYLVPAVIMVD